MMLAQLEKPDRSSASGSSVPEAARVKPRPVLSLIVSGRDRGHALIALSKLAYLKTQKNVKVGNVFIVGARGEESAVLPAGGGGGGNPAVISDSDLEKLITAPGKLKEIDKEMAAAERSGQTTESFTNYANAAGLKHYEFIRTEEVLDRLKVNASPTWIVRHLGQDYIFEGLADPTKLFDSTGEFTGTQ